MRAGRSRRPLGLALAASLLLSACAARQRPASRSEDPDAVTGTPVPAVSTPTGEPTPLEVAPREGLVDVRPRPWEDAEPLNQRTLSVRFWSGPEECYGLDRVEVDYRQTEVIVTLFEGRVPAAEVCIEIALLKAVRVPLDEPLGERRVVDGARASG